MTRRDIGLTYRFVNDYDANKTTFKYEIRIIASVFIRFVNVIAQIIIAYPHQCNNHWMQCQLLPNGQPWNVFVELVDGLVMVILWGNMTLNGVVSLFHVSRRVPSDWSTMPEYVDMRIFFMGGPFEHDRMNKKTTHNEWLSISCVPLFVGNSEENAEWIKNQRMKNS